MIAIRLVLLFALICILQVKESVALNPCSAGKMWEAFREMKRVGCKNCDKYFHCMGNYNAIYQCSGPMRYVTAESISNMREWAGDGIDSAEDQAANRFGRQGGNCASKFLKAAKCAYNPSTKKCKW